MIMVHGVDIVDITSTEKLLNEPLDQFLIQCFTEQERASIKNGPERSSRLSGRFAVKEAVLKALGIGFGSGTSFKDVEVVPMASGAPSVVLHGKPAERAQELNVHRWLISTSHEGTMAFASVIGLSS